MALIVKLCVLRCNCWKYPGDVITCELLEVSGTKRNSVALKQWMTSLGYNVGGIISLTQILRLCRCVSKLLQSESRR
ncbi:unnamed protein product [Brassica oleracea]